MDLLPSPTSSQLKAQESLAGWCEEVEAAFVALSSAIDERDAALRRAIWAKVPDDVIIATTGFPPEQVRAMRHVLE